MTLPSPLTAGLIILALAAAIAWAIWQGQRGPNTRRDRRTPPTAPRVGRIADHIDALLRQAAKLDASRPRTTSPSPPDHSREPSKPGRGRQPDRTPGQQLPVRTLNTVRSHEQKPQTLGTPPPGSMFAERTNERDGEDAWGPATDNMIDITKEPYAKEHLADLPEDEQKEIVAMRQRMSAVMMNGPTPLPTEDAETTEQTTDLRQRVHALLDHFGSEGIPYRTLAELAGCSLSMAHKYGKEWEIQNEANQEAIEEREDAGTDNEGWYTDKDRIFNIEQEGDET